MTAVSPWSGSASSWTCTHGAPVREDVWLRIGYIVDTDSRVYSSDTGRQLITTLATGAELVAEAEARARTDTRARS